MNFMINETTLFNRVLNKLNCYVNEKIDLSDIYEAGKIMGKRLALMEVLDVISDMISEDDTVLQNKEDKNNG